MAIRFRSLLAQLQERFPLSFQSTATLNVNSSQKCCWNPRTTVDTENSYVVRNFRAPHQAQSHWPPLKCGALSSKKWHLGATGKDSILHLAKTPHWPVRWHKEDAQSDWVRRNQHSRESDSLCEIFPLKWQIRYRNVLGTLMCPLISVLNKHTFLKVSFTV